MKKTLSLLLCAVMLAEIVCLVACTVPSVDEDVSHTVTYYLNYDGGGTRELTVPKGETAIVWNAVREGYKLEGWCTTPFGEDPYDFTAVVTQDVSLYAVWREKREYDVLFDFGYQGAQNVTIDVDGGTLISEKYVPERERLGMTFLGWYKDEEKTQRWDFETDTVTGDMTLWADWEIDPKYVKRDDDGAVIYENVVVNILVGTPFSGMQNCFDELIERFNREYEGKIEVRRGTLSQGGQETYSLRIQQTPGKNTTESTYYSIADVYDMAGIAYDPADYYEGASRDAFVDGELTSIPLVASVPYIVYNKTLLAKYAPNGVLPTSYTELLTLLKAAWAGESGSNPDFTTIAVTNSWSFREILSPIAFLQNGLDFWTYDGSAQVTTWGDATAQAKAESVMRDFYNLFGFSGSAHGSMLSGGDILSAVKSGKTLMGVMSLHGDEASIRADSNLGVLSLSGLFTDESGDAAMQIPVHSAGMAFYNKASFVSSTQLAAAAVFTDWVSRNSDIFVEYGMYPLRRSAAETALASDSANAALLAAIVGEPTHMRTMDGMISGKTIVNTMFSEQTMVPVLQGYGDDIKKKIKEFASTLTGMFS